MKGSTDARRQTKPTSRCRAAIWRRKGAVNSKQTQWGQGESVCVTETGGREGMEERETE